MRKFNDYVRFSWQLLSGWRIKHERWIADLRRADLSPYLCGKKSFAVLDLAMPLLNGLDAISELRRVSPNTLTILLTMYTDRPYVLQALQAGARGYVLKTQAADDLVRAIHEVWGGAVYLSPGVAVGLVDAYLSKDEEPKEPLTARERQILQLVAEGKTTKAIAEMLGITFKTAESHRNRIMKKLDIHQTAGLVRYAIRRGLIRP